MTTISRVKQVLKVIWEEHVAPRRIKRIANYWDRTALACWQCNLGRAYGCHAGQRYRSCRSGGVVLVLLHFSHEFLFNPHFDLDELDYIIRKGIWHRIQRYTMRTEILSTFHTRVECISQRHYTHIETNACPDVEKCQKPCQLEARGLPSNTWMPGPTRANDSSFARCTSTQRRNKVPIGYNGTLQIHPQTAPSLLTIITKI